MMLVVRYPPLGCRHLPSRGEIGKTLSTALMMRSAIR